MNNSFCPGQGGGGGGGFTSAFAWSFMFTEVHADNYFKLGLKVADFSEQSKVKYPTLLSAVAAY